MHCLYFCVAVLACVPRFWPVCTDEKSYPAVLNFAGMLFLANYVFHFVINCRKEKALKRLTKESELLPPVPSEVKEELRDT